MTSLIPLDRILPNPEQPRVVFDQAALTDLAQSIRELGVIQPITVEAAGDGSYILHDGERRLRAARIAGLSEIPAHVVPGMNGTGSRERLMRALVANIQRADLNPIEEARAYVKMKVEHRMTQNAIAAQCGVSAARVSSRMSLLLLEKDIQDLIAARKLPTDARAAQALMEIPDSRARVKLAEALAGRDPKITTIIASSQRLRDQLNAERIVDANETAPSLALAQKKARNPMPRARWDALRQVGSLPPWGNVIFAARSVCAACALRDVANETTCKDCPAVDLILRLIDQKYDPKS